MRTSGPTARSAHAFSHLIETDLYAAVPGVVFPGGRDPAYPLIACQWRNARPDIRDNRVGRDGFAKVRRHPVHRAGSDRSSSHGSRSVQVIYRSARQAPDLLSEPYASREYHQHPHAASAAKRPCPAHHGATGHRRPVAPWWGQVPTSIFRGRSSARLGMRTVSTPFLRVASIFPVSSSPLSEKVRR